MLASLDSTSNVKGVIKMAADSATAGNSGRQQVAAETVPVVFLLSAYTSSYSPYPTAWSGIPATPISYVTNTPRRLHVLTEWADSRVSRPKIPKALRSRRLGRLEMLHHHMVILPSFPIRLHVETDVLYQAQPYQYVMQTRLRAQDMAQAR